METGVEFVPGVHIPTTPVPLGVLYDHRLTFGARLLYGLLYRYALERPPKMPSQPTLASELGITPRSLRNYLTELKGIGLLAIDPSHGNQPLRYHLKFIA